MPSLSAFFESPAAIAVRGRLVTFRAVRRTDEVLAVDVRALLPFVDETARAEAHRDADRIINSKYTNEAAPDGAREDERTYHVLFRALRDIDPPHAPLARTAEELRGALTLPVVQELWAEYQRYLAEEFPSYVDPVEFGKLVEAAKKKPLPDLLPEFDSAFVRRSMPGLAALLLPLGTPR